MRLLPHLHSRASLFAALALSLAPLATRCAGETTPIAVPVLVVATYETGKDRGDTPGELQFWAERQDLKEEIKVPGVDHPVLTNGKGLYAMVCGTTSRCAVQIMALAADPRFDLTHTYVLLSGIGGGFPKVMSLGSAVWVLRVLDGNPAFEIDSREIPPDWSSGIVAIGAKRPGEGSANVDSVPDAGISDNASEGIGPVAFKLNPSLVKWAFELTKDVQIPDSEPLRSFGRSFKGYPIAQTPPTVLVADSIGGDRFFHGEMMARWAEDWDRIYTRGQGRLAISDCEDAGACLAFLRLSKMGKVDFNRLLVLRTACNFTVPPTGVTAEKSLFADTVSDSSGVAYTTALEADYRVGIVVVQKLLADQGKYHDEIP